MKAPFLLGRLVFGGYFLYSGIHHFQELRQLSRYAGAKRVPLSELAVAVSGAALVAGGTSILLGAKPKFGTTAIAAFLGTVSPVMHDFWKIEDPGQRMNESINFGKNMALLGASLAFMAMDEPWPASVPIGESRKLKKLGRQLRRSLAA